VRTCTIIHDVHKLHPTQHQLQTQYNIIFWRKQFTAQFEASPVGQTSAAQSNGLRKCFCCHSRVAIPIPVRNLRPFIPISTGFIWENGKREFPSPMQISAACEQIWTRHETRLTICFCASALCYRRYRHRYVYSRAVKHVQYHHSNASPVATYYRPPLLYACFSVAIEHSLS